MTQAQAMMSALVMLSLEAIDLYVASEDLLDVYESERMRKDVPSLWAAAKAVHRARYGRCQSV
jgi:hypothetical protein